MGTLTARTQRDIEIDRAIAGRCPRCGSPKTGPGGIRMQDGQPRDVGVSCDTCDYLHDGTQVVYDRPFVAPGNVGSHDSEADYREAGE